METQTQHRLLVMQQAAILLLLIVVLVLAWEMRKYQRAIAVLVDAVYTLQQIEEQRIEQAPAEERKPSGEQRTF